MAAHADPLPEYGSQAYDELDKALCQACTRGDLATLQRAGAAALFRLRVQPFYTALKSRHAHVLAWLVEESERTGIDIADGWTAHHVAAYRGALDALKAASDEELWLATGWDDETVLHAAAVGDQAAAIEYLVRERGLDMHKQSFSALTALQMASKSGCVSAIDALVACGARLHDEPGEPCAALMTAAEGGQVAAMEKLVELGADAELVGSRGSVIHAAAQGGSVEAIDAAVRLGADPRAVDHSGGTALHSAAEMCAPGGMRRLIQLGVPLDGADQYEQTALHRAWKVPAACRALLELGADRWIKDDGGCTARDLCRLYGNACDDPLQVAELLDTYWPMVPSMAQLLLGLKGPTESSLTRFAAHSAFEPKVLSLVNCLLVGKEDKAFDQLVRPAPPPAPRQARRRTQG